MVPPLDYSYVVCRVVTLRELGLSFNEIQEKLGLKFRSTAQTAHQLFLRTTILWQKSLQTDKKSSAKKSNEIRRGLFKKQY